MTVNELLAMVGQSALASPMLDEQLSRVELKWLEPGEFRPHKADRASLQRSHDEANQAVVYVVVPLSMLSSPSPDASNTSCPPGRCYRFGGWSFSVMEQSLAEPGGGVLYLPKAESALLLALVEHPRQVVARRTLALRLRHPNRPIASDRAVDSYVCRLRARFRQAGGSEFIASVRSAGYRFDSEVSRT